MKAPLEGEFTYNVSAQVTEAGRLDDATSGDLYSPNDSVRSTARRSQFQREDELLLRAVYSLEHRGVKQVYGVETTRDNFGKNGLRDSDIISSNSGVYPDGTFHNRNDVYIKGQWNVSTYAAFSELQWDLADQWTAFAGLRIDKHDYTDWFASPRAALVYKPNQGHVFKAIANQSVKRASEIDMRIAYLEDEKAVEEKISSIEITHETVKEDRINYKSSLFMQEVEFWSFNQNLNRPVGTLKMIGAEFELFYTHNKHHFSINHSFTKLAGFSDSNNSQYISAEPYGYGNDLNTWSNHLSKFVYSWNYNDRWSVTSSFRAYWGFNGAEDYGDYNNEEGSLSLQQRFGYDDDGEAFKGNYFLNFGAQLKVSEKLKFRFNAYNVLGLSDKKYNKRNYLKRFGDYRAEAAALALDMRYTF